MPELKIGKPSDTLQGSLQSNDLDLSIIPTMVEGTLSRLKELKETPSSSTWFKNHSLVFSDPELLGKRNITVTESDKFGFIDTIYKPYIQSVVDYNSSRMLSSGVVSAFSIFDPQQLPDKEESLSNYGAEKLKKLISFYGEPQKVTIQSSCALSTPDIKDDLTEAEWKIFRRLLFTQFQTKTVRDVISSLLSNNILTSAIPNLATLAMIESVNPVTTCTVERSFHMKIVKTRLRNRLGDETLDMLMKIAIEGPKINNDQLDMIIDLWKTQKPRRLAV